MTARTIEVPLRWSDLDLQGHVNNVTVLDLLQEARVRLLQDGPAAHMMNEGVVVVSHQVEYRAPIFLSDEPACVEVGVSKVGGAEFQISYALSHGGTEAVRALTVLCPYDVEAGQPRRLHDDEREHLRRFACDGFDLSPLPTVTMGTAGDLYQMPVRWSDEDRFRHVNNTVYFELFQEARIRMMMREAPEEAVGTDRRIWFLARQDVDYLRPLVFRPQPWTVRSGVLGFGNTSMTVCGEIRESEAADAPVHARVRSVLVCADERGVPQPISQELRDRLGRYLIS